jgi:hypothetical protein
MSEHEHNEKSRLTKIEEILECLHEDVKRMLRWIALKKIDFIQVGGSMNFSIVRGAAGTFTAVLTPANGTQAPSTLPAWAADDTTIVLNPSADGLSCEVTAPLGGTVTAFHLSIKATSSDPSVGVSGVVNANHAITITEPTPPPPTPLQSIDFVQSAG